MHELGIMIEAAKTVENFAKNNALTAIDTVVLQVGELSAVVPQYAHACWPAAVDRTMLENTKLRIEIIPADAMCRKCGTLFNPVTHMKTCPDCGSDEWELMKGKEFLIKEVLAR